MNNIRKITTKDNEITITAIFPLDISGFGNRFMDLLPSLFVFFLFVDSR